MRNDLTQADVRRVFHYDPATGQLTYRQDGSRKAKAGAVAGHVDQQGYRLLKMKGFRYAAGRVIWLYMTGAWPKDEIDHINLVRDDDRWENLREATRSENCINKGRFFKANHLGYRGVKRNNSRFTATICVQGKETCLGNFPTVEMAALAYDVASKKLNGAFARFNFPEKMHRDWLIV